MSLPLTCMGEIQQQKQVFRTRILRNGYKLRYQTTINNGKEPAGKRDTRTSIPYHGGLAVHGLVFVRDMAAGRLSGVQRNSMGAVL